MNLKQIITKYTDPEHAPLGEDALPRVLTAEERQHLRDDLLIAIARNRNGFVIIVSLIVTLFLLNGGVVVTHLDSPTIIQAATAALGVSAAGLITWMVRLWSEKSRLEILAVFAVNMEGEALKTLLNVLASSWGSHTP